MIGHHQEEEHAITHLERHSVPGNFGKIPQFLRIHIFKFLGLTDFLYLRSVNNYSFIHSIENLTDGYIKY
jgi:hypothetical protein